jgi:hypothetical protein
MISNYLIFADLCKASYPVPLAIFLSWLFFGLHYLNLFGSMATTISKIGTHKLFLKRSNCNGITSTKVLEENVRKPFCLFSLEHFCDIWFLVFFCFLNIQWIFPMGTISHLKNVPN